MLALRHVGAVLLGRSGADWGSTWWLRRGRARWLDRCHGCCGGVDALPRCYYPEDGDDLSAIIAEDQSQQQDPTCAVVGCSIGIHYACCLAAPPDPDATYAATYIAGGLDRVEIEQTTDDGQCVLLPLVWPASVADVDYRLTLSDEWGVEWASRAPCDLGLDSELAVGELGTVSMDLADSILDAHFTLFFAGASGEREAVRFDADGLPLS